ncbi:MAG: hypothetical protein ACRDZR_12935, partial [Acidimicrobiales bacterium]
TTAVNGSAGRAAPAERVRPGRTVTVDLPYEPGLAWGPVRASGRAVVAGKAGRAVLRPVPAGTGHAAAGTISTTFMAARPGVATLSASARSTCGRATLACTGTRVSWSARIEVRGP